LADTRPGFPESEEILAIHEHPRATQFLTVGPGFFQSTLHSFPNDFALELGEGTQNV